MSAEEMRTELESFVSQGLAEGWQGWPTTRQSCSFAQWQETYYSVPTTMALFQRVRESRLLGSSGRISLEFLPQRSETWLR